MWRASCRLRRAAPTPPSAKSIASLEEAGRITGASWWLAVRRILFPLSRPGLLVAFLLVFIPSFSELSATILLYTGGTETIAIAIYRLNDLGQLEVVSALAVFTIAVVLALTGLVNLAFGLELTSGETPPVAGLDAMAFIEIAGIAKQFGAFQALSECEPCGRGAGIRDVPRPFGLRQDHDAAHARGFPHARLAARSMWRTA